jgi:hypothetical protein
MRLKMTKFLTVCLLASTVALTACASGSGKSYPAPYGHERTAGAMTSGGSEHVFEKKMTK